MSSDLHGVQEQLQALRTQYLQDLPKKIDQLRACYAAVVTDTRNASLWNDVGRVAHGLAGSGTTFGCPEVSSFARAISDICQECERRENFDLVAAQQRITVLIGQLSNACHLYIERAQKTTPVTSPVSTYATTAPHAPLIYIVDDDAIYAESIAAKLRASHYRAEVMNNTRTLRDYVDNCRPDAIIMDMVFAEGNLAGADATHYYARTLNIPVLFISMRDDFEARLAAVRAGARFYFAKPVELTKLVAFLDPLTTKQDSDRYRILVVDDDKDLAAYYAGHLEAANLQVTVTHNAMDAISWLKSSLPDLILLDVEMPEISGLELAALIRQMDEFSHVPIVFLSADTTIQTHLASMHLGADDFLHKPIEPQFLVHSLKSRSARARSMRDGRRDLQRAMRDLRFMEDAVNEHAIVAITDLEGRIEYVNDKFSEISGYSLTEVVGKTHRIVKSGVHPASVYVELWDTISSGKVWHGTLTNRAKNGSLYDVSTTIVPKLDETGVPEHYISIRTDVTAIKSLEKKLTQQAERLILALEATESGAWEWNMATGKVIRYSSELGNNGAVNDTTSWPDMIHEDDFDDAFAALISHIDGNSPAYISEHRIRNSRGNWDWVRDVGKVVERDVLGHPLRIVGTTQLINERVALQEQEKVLQERLLQAAKMESIGHLTAGIAHDFNNLLGSILGYAELGAELIARGDTSDKLAKYIERIRASGNRAKDLISQMLVFSRLRAEGEANIIPVTLIQPVIKEIVYLLRSSIPSSIEVNYRVQRDDLRVRVQPVQLHQVLMNLVINARDAIDTYGKIDICLAHGAISSVCDGCHQPFNGDYVDITVHDTGRGIAENMLPKIFAPFFTTKDVGKGSGMGLSVVHGIVHAVDGHIRVESVAGKGTTMHILLPAVDADNADAKIETVQRTDMNRNTLAGLRLMVVDDEQSMASMLQELLVINGAQVSAFYSPTEALAAFLAEPKSVDLVVTDETMPQLSGTDMAHTMMQVRPELPVILCTGFSEKVNADIAKKNGIAGFMYKPIVISTLLTLVQTLTQKP